MSFNSVPFWLYFGFLLMGLMIGSRFISHPWLFLLRSFFPNWQFYHALGHTPRVYWRLCFGLPDDPDTALEWIPLLNRHQRRLLHLLHHPEGNLTHAHQTLIDQLAQDVADRTDPGHMQEWVSYRMVERLVREKIAEHFADAQSFQFCLCLPHITAPIHFDTDITLQSPILRMQHG